MQQQQILRAYEAARSCTQPNKNVHIFCIFRSKEDNSHNSTFAFLSVAQNHEEVEYKCPQMSDCPYTGFKLVQKIRFNTQLSEETLHILNGILGTIHLRRRQILTIFDPYPPTIGIPVKCLKGIFDPYVL